MMQNYNTVLKCANFLAKKFAMAREQEPQGEVPQARRSAQPEERRLGIT